MRPPAAEECSKMLNDSNRCLFQLVLQAKDAMLQKRIDEDVDGHSQVNVAQACC